MTGIFTLIEFWQRELLLFSAIWFLIGAIDDLCIDAIWCIRRVYRHLRYYRQKRPQNVDELANPTRPGLLAIFVATWREATVIGSMLHKCKEGWQGKSVEYRIYVGCYPNDSDGIAVILKAADADPHVRLVLVANPGPTTKADCLNRLWQALMHDELTEGRKAKAVILHDAEDHVHPEELRIYDLLIERNQVVQLPVVPVMVPGSKWVSGHYLDEFAEAHGKSLVVREAIGAALPLAGVGCAIDRNILGRVALDNGYQPFDDGSLTEDYELGLRIGALGGRTIIARVNDAEGLLIGTRSCFPDTITASVQQKARWLTGIALSGWDRLGWKGGFVEFWMLVRDRRAIFAAIVLCAAYLCIILTAFLIAGSYSDIHQPASLPPAIKLLLWINSGFLAWRLLVRAVFVGRLYGSSAALLSIPRTFVANIIGIMAARKACFAYLRHCFGGQLSWEKTNHQHFPETVSNRD